MVDFTVGYTRLLPVVYVSDTTVIHSKDTAPPALTEFVICSERKLVLKVVKVCF